MVYGVGKGFGFFDGDMLWNVVEVVVVDLYFVIDFDYDVGFIDFGECFGDVVDGVVFGDC